MVLVEASVNRRRNPPQRCAVAPRHEVRDLGVAVVGVFRCQQSDHPEKAIAEEVTPEGRCPAGVAAIKTPWRVGK